MEYEYEVRDPELFEQILPTGIRRLRVQTVDGGPVAAPDLLRAFGQATETSGAREHVVQRVSRADRVLSARRRARVLWHRSGSARDRELRAAQVVQSDS